MTPERVRILLAELDSRQHWIADMFLILGEAVAREGVDPRFLDETMQDTARRLVRKDALADNLAEAVAEWFGDLEGVPVAASVERALRAYREASK